MKTLTFPPRFPLKGKKRIGHDFLLYDFSEKADLTSWQGKNSLVRPEKPILFALNMERIEIWYRDSKPVMICSCSKEGKNQTCIHKEKLVNLFLPQLVQDIFNFYDQYFSKNYLCDEIVTKIRWIYPQSEEPAFQKAA